MSRLAKKKIAGFTLIELVMVIVILGILAAIAIPRLFDFSGDAKKATTLGILGAVRTAIALYYAKNALPPPTGGSMPWWPTLTHLRSSDGGPGFVMESKMADNPFSLAGVTTSRNDITDTPLLSTALRVDTFGVGNTGAWAYDESGQEAGLFTGQPYTVPQNGSDVGIFYAHTSSNGVAEREY
ncbi:MAG: type II secretion system protein [Planctomycetes bacterium]|nr:type II secretion system protein [Planctomycetota bacterium]